MPALTLQRFEQTGFLAADIGASAGMQNHLEIEARPENSPPQKSLRSRFLERRFQDAVAQRELAANVDKREMTIHGIRRNNHSLDQLMGIPLENDAVLARAWFALIGVAAEIGRLARILWNEA